MLLWMNSIDFELDDCLVEANPLDIFWSFVSDEYDNLGFIYLGF